ncbi:GNAT family N-acetyltransferase [Sphingomonas flavescens]|uniref:GNAT family N-acetyltransferase n=1 Tax=Sphingomonas flavescens TaxID=3132797 RepID=UPI0028050DEC|nr:GNAT family N-acetyltransferase [Sphingomonas limnosediminicola]
MATVESDVRINEGTSADLDAVMTVMEAAFGRTYGEAWTRSQLAGILPMTGVSLSVACDMRDHQIVGFALDRRVADEAELLLLAVLPERHRRGVGRNLLEDFLARSRNCGLSKVHLEVRDGNPATVMYRQGGFEAVGRRRNYYHSPGGERHDAITLALQL